MTTPAARRAMRSFPVETYYSGIRQSLMALEPIECDRCHHLIPPGAHCTMGGRAPCKHICWTCVPFWLPQEAPLWLKPPLKAIRDMQTTPKPRRTLSA